MEHSIISIFEEAFSDGVLERELRLSDEEVNLLQKSYPHIIIEPMDEASESKKWYRINIQVKK